MLKPLVSLAVTLLVSGCATAPQWTQADAIRLQQRAEAAPSLELCQAYVDWSGGHPGKPIVVNELNRRGESCAQFSGILQVRAQQRAAAAQEEAARSAAIMSVGAGMMARPALIAPAPMFAPPPPRPINCQSYRMGMYVNTSCR
ncbi:MAG: hypothetical protein QM766_27595 [Burkholderiaceae bacterium]